MSNRVKKGRYELVRRLGEGTQGETWEAIDHVDSLARDDTRPLKDRFQAFVQAGGKRGASRANVSYVAIKRFRVARAKAWKDVELAEREASTLASISHPLLPVYVEHFEEDGALYLVMEKIEGETVATLKRSDHEEVMRMLKDVGDALQYLHGRAPAIVHRDIKPSNVIRRPDGSFVIVDFGAVRDRLKPQGGSTVVGTFGYMAPEQFQGRASPKSDVYGAAATALRMLTGEEPEDLPHVGLAIDVAKSVPPGTPKALVRALERMTNPNPDERAGTIEEAFEAVPEPPKVQAIERRATLMTWLGFVIARIALFLGISKKTTRTRVDDAPAVRIATEEEEEIEEAPAKRASKASSSK